MLNDRDDKFEGHEESEYHFSDEEVSYEVEPETQKTSTAIAEPKESLIKRLGSSKRMLISGGVFFALVFVVYKMVSPTAPVVPTDIAAAPVSQQPAQQMAANTPAQQAPSAAQSAPAAPMSAQTNQLAASTQQPAAPQAMPQQNPAPEANAMPSAAQSAAPQNMLTPAQQQANAMPQAAPQNNMSAPSQAMQGTMGSNTQAMSSPAQPMQQMPQPNTQQTQQAMPQQPAGVEQANAQQPIVQVVSGLPDVIPVQTAPVSTAQQAQVAQQNSNLPGNVEAKISSMANQNDQMITQLENQYSQKVNDYANQNKALQDQVQTLNSRVANMESQMNQLIQVLTRQPNSQSNNPGAAPGPSSSSNIQPVPVAAQQAAQVADARVAYNVQAIIPGRAWLRSDNGETVTVAEGDVIKDLGRVSKIDPYDGIVEINTGSKVISLSYGNGSG